MKKCMRCDNQVSNPKHDLCSDCWQDQQDDDSDTTDEESFEDNLDFNEIHTVYVMFYGDNQNKIGYTKDINSRLIEIKREYPQNRLVYFREFVKETEARKFESWLKELPNRQLSKFISTFQDKLKKINFI